MLKDAQRHPVRGHTMHVDFLRVNLNVAIHAVVTLELLGGEDAPGTIEGGVLEHVTREVNIEALPNDIPERLQLDVSTMDVNDTLYLVGRHGARRASRSSTTSTRPSSRPSPRPSSRPSSRRSTRRPRSSRRPSSSARARRPTGEEGEGEDESGGDDAAGESSE